MKDLKVGQDEWEGLHRGGASIPSMLAALGWCLVREADEVDATLQLYESTKVMSEYTTRASATCTATCCEFLTVMSSSMRSTEQP